MEVNVIVRGYYDELVKQVEEYEKELEGADREYQEARRRVMEYQEQSERATVMDQEFVK